MNNSKQLLHYVQTFFRDYLSAHRGLSSNTVFAYRDALKLFLVFLSKHARKHVMKLTLDDLKAEVILSFLDDIEKTRKNSPVTRNLRLSSLRTFFVYLATKDILRAAQYQQIVSIPLKKAPQQSMQYLEVNEVKTILDAIDCTIPLGRRDYVLLSLLYNTGARSQEICDLRVRDLRLETPSIVTITGKGRKTRQVPLWLETVALLRDYVTQREIINKPDARIFANARGEPIGRFGLRYIIQRRVAAVSKKYPGLSRKKISPHTFRHTTAMHLLQSGVDLTVIKSWLGHVNLSTTHAYVEIDLNMKRKALSACAPMGNPEKLQQVINQNKNVISWLESL